MMIIDILTLVGIIALIAIILIQWGALSALEDDLAREKARKGGGK